MAFKVFKGLGVWNVTVHHKNDPPPWSHSWYFCCSQKVRNLGVATETIEFQNLPQRLQWKNQEARLWNSHCRHHHCAWLPGIWWLGNRALNLLSAVTILMLKTRGKLQEWHCTRVKHDDDLSSTPILKVHMNTPNLQILTCILNPNCKGVSKKWFLT